MTLSMYQASVPVFLHTLAALSAVLDKAAAHAAQRKIEPAVLLNTRLFPGHVSACAPSAANRRFRQGRQRPPGRASRCRNLPTPKPRSMS